MENKFALTCINEQPSVVSVKIFDTIEEARECMKQDAKRECDCLFDDVKPYIKENYAEVNCGECQYIWNIVEVQC